MDGMLQRNVGEGVWLSRSALSYATFLFLLFLLLFLILLFLILLFFLLPSPFRGRDPKGYIRALFQGGGLALSRSSGRTASFEYCCGLWPELSVNY